MILMNEKVELFFESIKNKHIIFIGAGVSNTPLIEMFAQKGAVISVRDKTPKENIACAEQLEKIGVTFNTGEDYLENLDADIIFRTPGLSFNIPELIEAKKRGVVITSEMEMFFDLCPCRIFAITGSDGKTTTTSIVAQMLKAQGKTVHLGGNIGTPLLPKIEEVHSDDIAVVELSSFQLMSMRTSPDVSVVTNVTPNHLDVHKDMQEYTDSKRNVFIHQNAFGRTVLNLDNELTKDFAEQTRGETLMFSRRASVDYGIYVDGEDIVANFNGNKTYIMKCSDIKIPGNHNIENYLAAIGAVWGVVDVQKIVEVAKTFAGVEHRAEFVRELEGVKYYNDSIASSPTRTISGTLSLYDEKIILIAGGYDKKIPFDVLGPAIVDKVKLLVLIGVTAPKIEEAVMKSKNYTQGNPKIIYAKDMNEAVEIAYKSAQKGDVVSLSPACASFDMYKNFAIRGNHFKDIVLSLK